MIGKDNVTNELYQKLKESEEKRIELEKELLRKEEEISILKKKVSNSLITMKKFSDMF
jgi:septal ring factor EnvC (AmiA/AmiB activator)